MPPVFMKVCELGKLTFVGHAPPDVLEGTDAGPKVAQILLVVVHAHTREPPVIIPTPGNISVKTAETSAIRVS